MKIFKRLVVEPLKKAPQRHHEKKVLVFVRFMEYYAPRGFPRYTFKRYLAFAKEAKYLDPYNAKFREGSLQTWP